MNFKSRFLELEEVLFFHNQEMKRSGGPSEIRDMDSLKAAVSAPKVTFSGEYLMDIFEMATTYINSICFNHPFLDGNKRVAALSALSFLYLNGYILNEDYDEELADKVLSLVTKNINKDTLTDYFRKNSKKIL